MPEGGEPRSGPEETERVIAEADAVLAENRRGIRQADRPASTGEPEPFRGLGEDVTEHRDRFERMLALAPETRRAVRRNEDGSKTLFAFVSIDSDDSRQIMKLREAAALAGVAEAFAPLALPAAETTIHLGWQETIPQDALAGRLQDPPWTQPEHEGTRDTPL